MSVTATDVATDLQKPAQTMRWGVLLVSCLLLIAASIAAYWPVSHNGFTTYDDPDYVTENGYVKMGLSAEGFKWAFTNTQQSANWHPLTWLSHMLDAQLFGAMNAPAQHWMSVGIHIAAAIVLFLSLYSMTNYVGCSLFVAMLFAIHPLRVESVVWAAERKDVLSALFWMLTLLAYWHYVKKTSMGRYLLVILAMVLGLLCKPMLVTLPVVLLLLDFWPLGRWGVEKRKKLILEKLPLLGLSLIAAIVTVVAQRSGQAVGNLSVYPLGLRVGNAIVVYSVYILKTFWPIALSPFYPHPGMREHPHIPVWQIASSLVALILITALVIRFARRAPYLFVGWFWYVITLVPVIGIVQVGKQAMADRYTYIPSIGLYIMLAWGMYDLAAGLAPRATIRSSDVSRGVNPAAKWGLVVFSTIVIVLCIIRTNQQTRYWKNDYTLFSRALELDPQNFLAYDIVGNYYMMQGKQDQALAQYQAAQKARPQAAEHEHDMAGNVFKSKGDLDRAAAEYEKAIKLQPNLPETHNNLGQIYSQKGDSQRAMQEYRLAIQYGPMIPQPYHNLGLELARNGNYDAAIPYFEKALELKPDYKETHRDLAHALRMLGYRGDAAEEYHNAMITGLADDINVVAPLAWIYATDPRPDVSNPKEALELAKKCVDWTQGQNPLMLDTLAAAQARNGQFAEAIASAQSAQKLAQAAGQTQLANDIESRIMLYQKNQPYLVAPKTD
jgi:Flp pilus assembly protein TadD